MPSSSSHVFTIAGLTEREASLWHVLTENGSMNVLQIARAISLNRPAVYALLSSLIEKELIEPTMQAKRTLYRSRGTKALEQWRARREQAFSKEMGRLKSQEQQTGIVHGDEVRVYHGKEIRKVWEEILKSLPRAGVFYRYDVYAPEVPVTIYLPKTFYEDMEQKRIDRFVITNARLRKAFYKKRLACASHVLPPSVDPFEQGVSQFVFGNRVAFVDFTSETAYIIKNKAIADYQKHLFRFVYQTIEQKAEEF